MPEALPFFKSLLFSLENGRSLSQAILTLQQSSQKRQERQFYEKLLTALREGQSFSYALQHFSNYSAEIIQFITMAEKSHRFKGALGHIVTFLDVKEEFYKESSDKISLPLTYFILATIIVLLLRFAAIPYQMDQMHNYDANIQALISSHLANAFMLSDMLFVLLIVTATYFTLMLTALFNQTRLLQNGAKQIGLYTPFLSPIIIQFEKFMLFTMLGEMLLSGISFKETVATARQSSTLTPFKRLFERILQQITLGKKEYFSHPVFTPQEQSILHSVGSMRQMGETFAQISRYARSEAMLLSGKYFRMMTVTSIFLMAFAVFIEFFTVVLTQVLIQKGMVNAVDGAQGFLP